MPPDSKPLFLEFDMHARRAMGLVGRRELRTDMRQQDQILFLPATGRAALPDKIPALAEAVHHIKSNVAARFSHPVPAPSLQTGFDKVGS